MKLPDGKSFEEERERMIFRLLLVNKWFLIPTSVAYETTLAKSPFPMAVYSHITPTIFYTATSLVVILLLWLTYRRLADGSAGESSIQWVSVLSVVSFSVDLLFVFFLVFVPGFGNMLWILFLPPISLVLLAPHLPRWKSWVVDGPIAAVMLVFLAGVYQLLIADESLTPKFHYLPADLLICLAGLLFIWVDVRLVRSWLDIQNKETTAYAIWNSLWMETIHHFPMDVFLVNEQGEVAIASESVRKLLALPDDGSGEWPEETQSVRNALLLRFHAESDTGLDETITVPDDNFPVKIFPSFFTLNEVRYCIALAEEDNPDLPKSSGVMRSDRLTIAGQIAAGLAHELGNPLGVIQSCSSYLRQKITSDDPNREEFELIESEVKRCQNLIDRLLSLASPKRDTPGVHDLRDILQQSYSLVKYQAGDRTIELNAPNDPMPVFANEGQLSAVFVNLFLNALQSMEAASPEAMLRIHSRVRGGEAIVDVTDEGAGIPGEELERIFDPFFTKKAQGTGLGLSIVHQIVSSMNGRIDVASKVGAGTTFTVYLPLHKTKEE